MFVKLPIVFFSLLLQGVDITKHIVKQKRGAVQLMNKKDKTVTQISQSPPHLLSQTLHWNHCLFNHYWDLLTFWLMRLIC